MSNGLEREFPEVAWQPVPPVGPRGMPPEVIRGHIAHGRELHSRAIRDSMRTGLGAVARALVAVSVICRRSSRGPTGRPPERDSWAGSAHGA